MGFRQFRVRHHGELVRIEIAREELDRMLSLSMFEQASAALKKLGYKYVTLDLEGYRSGSMNAMLPVSQLGFSMAQSFHHKRWCEVKIAYLDCFSGISGDMFLAALVDAGVPFSVMENAVSAVGLEARLELRRVNRSGIDAAKVDVLSLEGKVPETVPAAVHVHAGGHDHSHEQDHTHSHDHGHAHEVGHVHGRSLSVIQGMIGGSRLPLEIQATALRAFGLLGHAEAKIHNVPVKAIHFHEVGAVDAIADIVAAAAGCHWLNTERNVERWICSPLNVGGGHVHCAHGVFPVPAPATVELLRDLPVYSSGVQKELVTPTGAALASRIGCLFLLFVPCDDHSCDGIWCGIS